MSTATFFAFVPPLSAAVAEGLVEGLVESTLVALGTAWVLAVWRTSCPLVVVCCTVLLLRDTLPRWNEWLQRG